jgi:predicted transcriptional regulator of viral defense system
MGESGAPQGGLGKAEREVMARLIGLGAPSVGVGHVMAVRGMSRPAANLLLSRLARKGWLHRLRRGAYAVVPFAPGAPPPPPEDPLAVASHLFEPCYVSGWSAAHHWGLTAQAPDAIYVFSAKPQRRGERLVAGTTYRVRRAPKDHVFGTVSVKTGAATVEIADLHRTLIDVLDAPEMAGGGGRMLDIAAAYWQRPDADPQLLLKYALKIGRGVVFKRLGYTAQCYADPDEGWLLVCRDLLSKGVSLLDPAGPNEGPIVTRWRIRDNVPEPDEPREEMEEEGPPPGEPARTPAGSAGEPGAEGTAPDAAHAVRGVGMPKLESES